MWKRLRAQQQRKIGWIKSSQRMKITKTKKKHINGNNGRNVAYEWRNRTETQIVCIFACTSERRKRFHFLSYLCLSTGILSMLTVRPAVSLAIADHRYCNVLVYCCCLFFGSLFTCADIVFILCVFNFPFAAQQTQPTYILLIDSFFFFWYVLSLLLDFSASSGCCYLSHCLPFSLSIWRITT